MDWGILFDWDGVIVDSSEAHEESWERLADNEGKSLPEGHFKLGFGKKNEVIIPELLNWAYDEEEIHRLSMKKEKLYRQIVKEKGLSPLPGVSELVYQLKKERVPFSIASSTHRENIESVLSVIGLDGEFPWIVSAEDVKLGKPHPEVFQKAAEKIKVVPARCIVFEDTPVGLEAARAGGMKSVGVLTSHPKSKLHLAQRWVIRLDDLSFSALRELAFT